VINSIVVKIWAVNNLASRFLIFCLVLYDHLLAHFAAIVNHLFGIVDDISLLSILGQYGLYDELECKTSIVHSNK
jgi:hypothetical protein